MIEAGLELEQFTAAEDLVDRHLLGHVAQLLTGLAGISQGVNAGNAHLTGIRSQQGAEDAQAGGLASTIGTEQAIKAALRHLQADPVEGLQCAITLAQSVKSDHRRAIITSTLKTLQRSKAEKQRQLLAELARCLRAREQ